ncbi:MAG TPA: tRNA pseudouridine(55) synthase TruB [Desulfobacteraceae bacterium]|nr:tRNA pseudouridine(55) synthase TruB [Desulfobacteraceae bacterium]
MVNGMIAVEKPEGLSSARAVARIKKRFKVKKAGHAGTLDPFATGVLLCGLNKGTKLSRFLLNGEKKYRAVVRLGVETDTLDSTGTVEKEHPSSRVDDVTEEKLQEIIEQYQGVQSQVPPVYSALKHNGQPLYRLARKGTPVEKPPRTVAIHAISLVAFSPPLFTIDVHCSAGTYIRSLARDMGQDLGCGGHLAALARTECCGFPLSGSLALADLESMPLEDAQAHVVPMAETIPHLPVIHADDRLMEAVTFGRSIDSLLARHAPAGGEELSFFRVLDKNRDLAAIVQWEPTLGEFKYSCVFAN